MTTKERANYLIEKFGGNAIISVEYALDIWETKLKYAKEDKHEIGIEICLTTLSYYNKVKNIINEN